MNKTTFEQAVRSLAAAIDVRDVQQEYIDSLYLDIGGRSSEHFIRAAEWVKMNYTELYRMPRLPVWIEAFRDTAEKTNDTEERQKRDKEKHSAEKEQFDVAKAAREAAERFGFDCGSVSEAILKRVDVRKRQAEQGLVQCKKQDSPLFTLWITKEHAISEGMTEKDWYDPRDYLLRVMHNEGRFGSLSRRLMEEIG